MIQRFYDPLQGRVLIDDVDIRDVNVSSLRSHIGVVSQEPILFSGTIIDNISLGFGRILSKEDYNEKTKSYSASITNTIEESARKANAYNFIQSLPQAFKTFVGEGIGFNHT